LIYDIFLYKERRVITQMTGKWEDELERITHCSGKKNFSKNL